MVDIFQHHGLNLFSSVSYLQTCIQYVPHGHGHPVAIHRVIGRQNFRQKSVIPVEIFCNMLSEGKKDM